MKVLGKNLRGKIGDLKSKSYFIQNISDVQRENAATTISSLPAAEGFVAVPNTVVHKLFIKLPKKILIILVKNIAIS